MACTGSVRKKTHPTKLDAHPRIRSIKKPCNLRCLSNSCICPKHWGKKNLQTGMLLLDRFFQVSLSIAISRSLVCPDRQNDHIADIVLVLASASVWACWWPLFLSHGYESKPWYHLVPSGSLKSPGNGCFFPQNPPNMVYFSMYFMGFDWSFDPNSGFQTSVRVPGVPHQLVPQQIQRKRQDGVHDGLWVVKTHLNVCRGWACPKDTSEKAGFGSQKTPTRIVLPCKPYQTLSNFAMLGFWVSINCTLFVMFPEQSSLITLASLVMNYTAPNTVPIVSFWSFWDFYMAQQTSESLAVLGPHHHNKSTHIFANRSPSTKLLPTLGYKKKSK